MTKQNKHDFCGFTLRSGGMNPVEILRNLFGNRVVSPDSADAVLLDASANRVLGWCGLDLRVPICRYILNSNDLGAALLAELGAEGSGLLVSNGHDICFLVANNGEVSEVELSKDVLAALKAAEQRSAQWAGELTADGDHVFDPRTPLPGTHFRANVLIGDRGARVNPLLMTPKAVVDGFGGGSSRSHANKEILQTQWGPVPDENGFPINRQFYLVEDGKQIFYSGCPTVDVVMETRHCCNYTTIRYELPGKLEVTRTFFVLPASDEVPYAMEAQLIEVENKGNQPRNLHLVNAGMLGFPHPGALTVDVIYTCVTVQPRVLKSADGMLAVSPDYTANWGLDDLPFNVTQGYDADGKPVYPDSFCLDYSRFIGSGSLAQPENVTVLDNDFPKKGPAFFAVGVPMNVSAGGKAEVQSYCGSISRHEGEAVTDECLCRHLDVLADCLATPTWGWDTLRAVKDYQNRYRSAVQVSTPDARIDNLVNSHLPFQIRYQTYVSRSFGLTQKGFRQIGFREIQDLFAALPFEVSAGRQEQFRDMIRVWATHVHRFGYADHQFYWEGIEPGRYSDDALWLFQAVGRYIDLTGDRAILDAEWEVAGEEGTRPLYDTLQAILTYSGRISIGKNGLPLIDRADWNDTLNLDNEGMPGPDKESLYRQQVADGIIMDGDPLQSDMSESVMNGFLLEVARQYMVRFAAMRDDTEREQEWMEFGKVLQQRLQDAWKGDFFARAYLNRPNALNATWLGGMDDGLSDDPALSGTYFLNSFSWSVLSGVATDEQVSTMLDRIEAVLLTPYGIRLSSPTRFKELMPNAGSGDYAYGDRENGGVFKHATMMAVSALLEGARTVDDTALAARMAEMGWSVLQMVAPFKTMSDPFILAGNPRLCTQYTNPATGEHVGPLLSGTAPWMWMGYMKIFGVDFRDGKLVVDPVLPEAWEQASLQLNVPAGRYEVSIAKGTGFARCRGGGLKVQVGGEACEGPLPAAAEGEICKVEVMG